MPKSPVAIPAATTLVRARSKITMRVTAAELWVGLPGFYSSTVLVETAPVTAAGLSVQCSLSDNVANCHLGYGGNTLGVDSGLTTFALNIGGISWVLFKAADFGLENFDAGSSWFIKHEYTGATGDQVVLCDDAGSSGITGESVYTGGTSQILTATAYTAGGGTSRTWRMAPVAVVARHSGVAWLADGDSITYGQGKAGGSGIDTGENCYGYAGRSFGATSTPFAKAARQGTRSTQSTPSNRPNALALASYATHYSEMFGTNEVNSGSSLATIQAAKIAWWAAIKGQNPAVKVYPGFVLPRATGATDGNQFLTAGAQTIPAVFEVGGVADQLNAWYASQVGTTINGYFNLRPGVEDPVAPGRWRSDGVTPNLVCLADGTHPVAQGHIDLAGQFTTFRAGL